VLPKEATKQMNGEYFGPNGLYWYIDDREYYIHLIHPDYKIEPLEVSQQISV